MQIVLSGFDLLRKYQYGPENAQVGGYGQGGEGQEYSEDVWLPLFNKKNTKQIRNKQSGELSEIHIKYKIDRTYDPVEAVESMKRAIKKQQAEHKEQFSHGMQLVNNLRRFCLRGGYNVQSMVEAFDADHSGTLDKDELRAGLISIGLCACLTCCCMSNKSKRRMFHPRLWLICTHMDHHKVIRRSRNLMTHVPPLTRRLSSDQGHSNFTRGHSSHLGGVCATEGLRQRWQPPVFGILRRHGAPTFAGSEPRTTSAQSDFESGSRRDCCPGKRGLA